MQKFKNRPNLESCKIIHQTWRTFFFNFLDFSRNIIVESYLGRSFLCETVIMAFKERRLINVTIFAASSKLSTANIRRSLVVKIALASSTRVPVKTTAKTTCGFTFYIH